MPAGLFAALALAAQTAAAYGPEPIVSAPTQAKPAQPECADQPAPDPNSREIVVCAVKPNGYRLDPDVLAARRAKKKGETIRPRSPHETFADHSCATVGPMGCRGQVMVDAFTAAAVLAEMAQRLSKGEKIGPMFQTQPAKGEYQLYLDAKQQREEAETGKAAKAKAAEARAVEDGIQSPAESGATPAPVR